MWDKPPDFDGEEPKEEKPAEEKDEPGKKDDSSGNIPEWVEVYDPASNAYYFYNNQTGECTWDRPEGYEKPKDKNVKSLMAPPLFAALMLQNAWRKKACSARCSRAAWQSCCSKLQIECVVANRARSCFWVRLLLQ